VVVSDQFGPLAHKLASALPDVELINARELAGDSVPALAFVPPDGPLRGRTHRAVRRL
jgi:hypothetical protein